MERNQFLLVLLPLLRSGRVTAAEAAWVAGVTRQRVWAWCKAAGFNAEQERERYLVTLYARFVIRINRESRIKQRLAARIKAKAQAKKPRKPAEKKKMRTFADAKVINFVAAGGKIKLIPKGKRNYPKPL